MRALRKFGWWLMDQPILLTKDFEVVKNWRWKRYQFGAWLANR